MPYDNDIGAELAHRLPGFKHSEAQFDLNVQRNFNSRPTHRSRHHSRKHGGTHRRVQSALTHRECVEVLRQALPKTGRITIEVNERNPDHPDGNTVHFQLEPRKTPDGGRNTSLDSKLARDLCRLMKLKSSSDPKIQFEEPTNHGKQKLFNRTSDSPQLNHPRHRRGSLEWAKDCDHFVTQETKWNQPLVTDCDYEAELAYHPALGRRQSSKRSDQRLMKKIDRVFHKMNKEAESGAKQNPFHVDRKIPNYRVSPDTLEWLHVLEDPELPDNISKRDLKHSFRKAVKEHTDLVQDDIEEKKVIAGEPTPNTQAENDKFNDTQRQQPVEHQHPQQKPPTPPEQQQQQQLQLQPQQYYPSTWNQHPQQKPPIPPEQQQQQQLQLQPQQYYPSTWNPSNPSVVMPGQQPLMMVPNTLSVAPVPYPNIQMMGSMGRPITIFMRAMPPMRCRLFFY